MNKKKIVLGKKLILNRETIAALSTESQQAILGKGTFTNPGCVGSNHCTQLECNPGTSFFTKCETLKKC